MKLLSFISNSLEDIKITLKRFPIPLTFAYLAGIFFMINIEWGNYQFQDYAEIATMMLLGFALTLAVDILTEVNKKNTLFKLCGYLVSAILMVLLFRFELDFENRVTAFRLMFIFGTAFLTVMLAPFAMKKQSINGFWQFNLLMLISILLSFVYFGLLQAGISALIGSFGFLFDLEIHEELFLHTFVFLSTFGASTFVLSRIPKDIKALENLKDYPKVLKVITTRIFVPVIGVYAILVYAFVVKLLINGQAPDYEVTFQIMAFSSVGVLAYLFVWPLKDTIWYLRHFHKFFFAYLIPLLAVLFVAIFRASINYGLTQTRYFVIAFGVIMTIWSLYYLFGRGKDIRLVHIVAGIISLFALFMPVVGAKPLSLYSNTQLIHNKLIEAGVVVDGAYINFDKDFDLDIEAERVINSSWNYIYQSYDEETADNIFEAFEGDAKSEWKDFFSSRSVYFDDFRYFNYNDMVTRFEGLEGMTHGYRIDTGINTKPYTGDTSKVVYLKDNILHIENYTFDIGSYVLTINESDPDLVYRDPNGNYVIYFEGINGREEDIEYVYGYVFVK